ncbi:hypothetical protein VTI74DRAFT_3872 [Chaetomium olivicolor]
MANTGALLILADDIKLSILDQKRAQRLNLKQAPQDDRIKDSLEKLKRGLDALKEEQGRLQEAGDESKASSLLATLTTLQKQYADLSSQFEGQATASSTSTLTQPNDPSLAADFAHAQSSRPSTSRASQPPQQKKAVRFSSPSTDLESQTARANLFPYRDDPSISDDDSAGYRDHIASSNLTNAQIHAYHQDILDAQDAQLDALGESIARQRELSLQIGDELDSQVLMLDESERAADRQANALTRARRQVGRIARGAANSGEGRQMGAIVLLIIILVLLIVVLK